jgi:His-Xaa-Ser system radical SAM maturase HxsC
MKSIKLKVKNVFKPIIGKVVTESSFDGCELDSYLCKFNIDSTLKTGYIIFGEEKFLKLSDYPIGLAPNRGFFAEGDVFLLEPSGLCTFLFESRSDKNSILLTTECNCRCILCPQPPENGRFIIQALEVLDLLDDDVQVLGITGGEPTYVWEDLITVLKKCRDRLPNTNIHLLTNARRVSSSERANELKEANNKIMACVTLFSEIDSLHDSIVSVRGAFWQTLKGIYDLAKANIPVEIRTVITKQNFHRLSHFCEFIYNYLPFTVHVALMGLEPIGFARDNISILWTDPTDYMVYLENAVKTLHRRGCSVSVYNHQLCTLTPYLRNFSVKSISDWKVSYMEECEKCAANTNCGGFFESASLYHSRAIHAL